MARVVSIGAQGFEELRTRNNFYVDKTAFIADWWQSDDSVTLITRPRRFGKTLMLDTVRCFFSTEFAERGEELFGGLAVWDDPEMRQLQGAVPVVSLSFSKVKTATVDETLILIKRILRIEVRNHKYLFDSPAVEESTRDFLASVADDMDTMTAIDAVPQLCQALEAHWGRKPIVLLDEYDTPMQAAWLGGFWDELSIFMRTFMDSSFKTNPALDRALMSGITRISRESIFSGLNNLEVCGVLDEKYQTAFGFT
ncbi:MAG: AAA family ATPase, partial [Atopobiaceae bacterium]|nr:AAA family ATPase [Atopobiaceae bacterium]